MRVWLVTAVLASLLAPPSSRASNVEFASFSVDKAKYKGLKAAPLETDPPKKLFAVKFQVKGTFTLGMTSNGLDFVNDQTRISFGNVLVVIPPGGLVLAGSGAKYQSKELNDIQQFAVKPGQNPGEFKYQIKAKALATPPPETLVIVIGDDLGEYEFEAGQMRAQKPSPTADVSGYLVTGSPPVPLSGVYVKWGSKTTYSSTSGFYSLSGIPPGPQTISFPLFVRNGYEYAAMDVWTNLYAGDNSLGTRSRVAHYLGVAPNILNGVAPTNIVSVSPPLAVGGTAKATLLSGSTVTLPSYLSSPQKFSLTEVLPPERPQEVTAVKDSPVMVVVGPEQTTVSACGDLEFPNPYASLVDSDTVPIDFFNETTGTWDEVGIGTVTSGASRIAAPGMLCEFGYYFPRCVPQTTHVIGTVVLNGVPVGANTNVSIQGRSGLTFAAKDLDGDGNKENLEFSAQPIGCVGFQGPIRVHAVQQTSSGYIDGTSAAAVPVPGGITDVGEVLLGYNKCGKPVASFPVPASNALAIDSGGNVYVTTGTDVEKFSNSGTPLISWDGSAGAGGAFVDAQGVAIDDADDVFVTDIVTGRVQRFDTSGTYVTHWDTPLSGPITAWAGSVYALEPLGMGTGVRKFDTSGTVDTAWPLLADPNPKLPFSTPVGIASNKFKGGVFVSAREGVVRFYDPAGGQKAAWSVKSELAGLDAGVDGTVFLALKKLGLVQKYSAYGNAILGFGKPGLAAGSFGKGALQDVAIGSGEVFTLEGGFGPPRVQRFACP